jgi:hypothetical protein
MKRYGHLWEQVTAFDNLMLAADKALRGQRAKPLAARFYFHRETELLRLQEELESGAYRPQPFRVFSIYEPKPRQICAAALRDRVLHHAVCHILDPIFERRMIADTYACRRGKGTHAALRRVQTLARRWPYYFQADIRQYFASIDHATLKALLRRMLKDARLLALLDLIIDQPVPNSETGCGLPIGNLTSQYFANLYLGELDHYLAERVGVGGYVRYMDDFLFFGKGPAELWEKAVLARDFLTDELQLAWKDTPVVAPTHTGIAFLGWRVFPSLVRLQASQWRRFKHQVRGLERAYTQGEIDETQLAESVRSMVSHLAYGDTLALRRRWLDEWVTVK